MFDRSTELTDTLLRELLRAETEALPSPAAKLTKAVDRIEQLLASTGFVETAAKLKALREEFEECSRPAPVPTPAVVGNGEDPLTGKRKRKRNLVATGDGVMEVKG